MTCQGCTPIPNFHNGCNQIICPCKCHNRNTLEVEGKGVEFCKHGVLDGKKLCYRCSDD